MQSNDGDGWRTEPVYGDRRNSLPNLSPAPPNLDFHCHDLMGEQRIDLRYDIYVRMKHEAAAYRRMRGIAIATSMIAGILTAVVTFLLTNPMIMYLPRFVVDDGALIFVGR